MTKLLEQAVAKVRELPADEQDAIARRLLHQIEEDRKWEDTTEKHADKLDRLVEGVLDADARGETEELATEGQFRR